MIQADSLASLNLLAANPPRYPLNPTDDPRDPLTLYISRVPGTRDLILSTLKPQRKNVTFEDVANALYYVHLDAPSDQAQAQAQAQAHTSTSPASIARKPVPAAAPAVQPLQSPVLSPAVQPPLQPHAPILRKPVGPRPLQTADLVPADTPDTVAPPLPPRPVPTLSPSPSPTRSSPPPPPLPPRPAPFQLTLIRRDPATHHQWNIGKIAGDEPPCSSSSATNTDDSPRIRVVLETSGYAKFRAGADAAFYRDVAMAYGRSWTAGLRRVMGESDRRADGKEKDAKPKGYAFASPWDGRCEFRTGHGGRSLKCRHILDSSGGGYNPLAIVQGFKDGQGLAAAAKKRARGGSLSAVLVGAAAVSELRFNLPSSEVFGRGGGGGGSSSSLGWGGRTSLSHDEASEDSESDSGSDSDDDDDEREDLLGVGLGREKAGGGSRGKRAKLGKLIVFDDGFKMLDLVVAANVGVWWVAWEKVF